MVKLTVNDHNRDMAGHRYIYPVISRRSGGLSIGINVNTNNACNWGCVYCQVPDLIVGTAPKIAIDVFRQELTDFLQDVLHGDFYRCFEVPLEQQMIKDIALSGNGEPTSLSNFSELIEVMIEVVEAAKIPNPFQYVLITNGSLVHKPEVQAGLKLLNIYSGQVWFKIDSVTKSGRLAINHSALSSQRQQENLLISTQCCATWVQSCVINFRGLGLILENEQDKYIKLLTNVPLQGVMLYSLARPSLQAEATEISAVSLVQLEQFAKKIRVLGLVVKVSL